MQSQQILFPRICRFIIFRCDATALRIEVNDIELMPYPHRIAPEAVNGLYVSGRVKLYKIKYFSPTVSVVENMKNTKPYLIFILRSFPIR